MKGRNGVLGHVCRPNLLSDFYVVVGIACLLLASLVSCSQKPPALAIDEDKLVEVLIDVHIAEAAVQSLRGATKDSVINAYYDQIFEIHGLSREEFVTTMEILRTDPKRTEELYSKIMAEMERQDVAEEEKEKE
ncbi:MAG: DUF4296 domain-containing protein [Lewinellaceae bacterium]|nr:DUF4296 domain-containing protein [Phaeodactylibacter sp.]MCB9350805.1 DUF4296 domain-containing protein [Lewinellaceae bacterium]